MQSLMANQAVGTSDSQISEGNDNNSDDDEVKNTDAMQKWVKVIFISLF